ncbi:hypothetical protein [Burkholderia sp. Ax-1719]|uniref:hypothetical protein n=1 Tax=Burkholderia sp. Ax-1719 TaxID=2608334 RepID=UPI001423843A|nr:hypothetical protein [Burkholderia sp. Ax-1719]NIE67428.1 hypothetical protein [Burkholderia sp. Ax-1719]
MKSDNPSVWSQPSTWIAFAAVLISLASLGVTVWDKFLGLRKDARSREQSIQDEFWLRKVLFPTSIEPAMTFATEVMGELPAATTTSAERLTYFGSFQEKHRAQMRKLMLVAPIWPNVFSMLEEAFELIEDAVAGYCNLPDSPQGHALERTTTTDALSSALSQIYVGIRDHQKSIGK